MKGMERFASMRKRYGWGGLLRNASGKLLRLAGLNVSRWYMYAIPVAETDFNDLDRKLTGYPFKELCLEDFRRQTVLNPDWFTPAKMDDVERGLGIEGNHAYGLYEGELLVCYGWISLERFGLSEERLLPTDAYLWDAYTHPAFRGKRLHKYLSIMCLRSIAGYGKSRAVVIVANYNRASRQTYERSAIVLSTSFGAILCGSGPSAQPHAITSFRPARTWLLWAVATTIHFGWPAVWVWLVIVQQ